jgi:hypothetical protein
MIVDNGRGLVFELDENSALDIGSCRLDGIEIAPGDAVPDDGDARILHSVSGFLFTCGPDHKGHPEPIEGMPEKKFPLHGSMAATPAAEIAEQRFGDVREISAKVTVALAQGGVTEIHRVWRINEATGDVELRDTLTNKGDQPFPPLWMYHMNIGAHLFSEQTMLSGPSFEDGGIGWVFGKGDGHVFCVPASDEPEGGSARVVLGPISGAGGKSLEVWFGTGTLPHLQMWRNQSGHCDVLGIEPVSHPMKKRTELHEMGLMMPLAPGESKVYGLTFAFR